MSNPYARLRALVTGDGAYAAMTPDEAEAALNAATPAAPSHRDVSISDVEGYLRARLLVTGLRDWVSTEAATGVPKSAALELFDIIASPRLMNFSTGTDAGRANILGMFALLVQAGAGGLTAEHLADLTAMTVKPGADVIPREQITWPEVRIWAADVIAARAMEG